jgi:hypothetical protein
MLSIIQGEHLNFERYVVFNFFIIKNKHFITLFFLFFLFFLFLNIKSEIENSFTNNKKIKKNLKKKKNCTLKLFSQVSERYTCTF